jgi:hypothetical protein
LPDDHLLYAVPVCGPYASMQSFKYRVKLTPGTLKRGKAFKQAMDVFAAYSPNVQTPLEKMLLKGVQDTEAVAVLVSDVRLSVPGLQQVKQKTKKLQRGQKEKS